jgi:hypothetical protein
MTSNLVAEIEAEVAEFQRRRMAARMVVGTRMIGTPEYAVERGKPSLGHSAVPEEHAMRDAAREGCTFVLRDPCLRCGVRADLHAELGCKRWRRAP